MVAFLLPPNQSQQDLCFVRSLLNELQRGAPGVGQVLKKNSAIL